MSTSGAKLAGRPVQVRDLQDERVYGLENQPLAAGGEAWIFGVRDEPALVAKIYKQRNQEPPDIFLQRRSEATEKVAVMLKHQPRNPSAAQGHQCYAWPAALVAGPAESTPIGFLMPKICGMREIFDFYNPGQRKQHCPYFDYRYLHQAARNTAGIMREVHSKGYVVGDVNQKNFLVSDRALVTVLDTDSFQTKHPFTNRVYLCRVSVNGFRAPELKHQVRFDVERTEEQDTFGLAVLIFHLLMEGVHPFSGKEPGSGSRRTLQDRIDAGDFSYAPGSTLPPMETAPPFDILHTDLRAHFIRCFVDGYRDPHARPTAEEWQHTLDKAAQELRVCANNGQHVYGQHLGDSCPWCARVAHGFKDSFPSRKSVQTQSQTTTTTPAASVSWTRGLVKFLFWLAIIFIIIYVLFLK